MVKKITVYPVRNGRILILWPPVGERRRFSTNPTGSNLAFDPVWLPLAPAERLVGSSTGCESLCILQPSSEQL
jgi:hypothetical protein